MPESNHTGNEMYPLWQAIATNIVCDTLPGAVR
jgi:hypothetical protein